MMFPPGGQHNSQLPFVGSPWARAMTPGGYSLSGLRYFLRRHFLFISKKSEAGPKFIGFGSAPKMCASFRELLNDGFRSLQVKVPVLKC